MAPATWTSTFRAGPPRPDAFDTGSPINELNVVGYDQDLHPTPDRHRVYFSSQRTGGGDLYEATR